MLAGPNKDSLVRQAPGPDTWHYDANPQRPRQVRGSVRRSRWRALREQATTASTTNPLRVEVRAITPL